MWNFGLKFTDSSNLVDAAVMKDILVIKGEGVMLLLCQNSVDIQLFRNLGLHVLRLGGSHITFV
jgi:hypothetical protein